MREIATGIEGVQITHTREQTPHGTWSGHEVRISGRDAFHRIHDGLPNEALLAIVADRMAGASASDDDHHRRMVHHYVAVARHYACEHARSNPKQEEGR